MVKKTEKSQSFEKNLKKKQENLVDDATHTISQSIEQGKDFGKESIAKINEITDNASDFIKSQDYLKTLKINSLKIGEKSKEQKNRFNKKSPKYFKKIINSFFYFFELIVGRIKIGTQYGISSLEILEKLAKLKELGIITDKEFTEKKKKILDRI